MSNARGEAVAEIMAGAGLKRLAVVHQRLDGVGRLGAGELVAVGLAAADDRHRQRLLAEVGVDVQHPLGLGNGLLGGGVDGVALLPEKLARCAGRDGWSFPSGPRCTHWLYSLGRSR